MKIPTIKNVITYTKILIFQFPETILAPAIVEDIIDGNLAIVDTITNLTGFIGNNPAIYANKSFGVPGIINKINIIISIFL